MFWSVVIPVLGFILLLKIATRVGRLLKEILGNELNLLQRYGEGSWVLITGGTDGIGWAFARAFAQRGFNLVLIGRSQEKLNLRVQEISQINQVVRVRTIPLDLSAGTDPTFFENLVSKVADLDVSVLVNNVGVMTTPYLDKSSPEQTLRELTLNCTTQALMLSTFLPKLTSRGQQSGVIDVSSCANMKPFLNNPLYSATKVFTHYLTKGLQLSSASSKILQLKNCDLLELSPSLTSTLMTGAPTPNDLVVTPEECVAGALRALGRQSHTHGSVKHSIYAMVMEAVYSLFPLIVADHIRMRIRNHYTAPPRQTR